MNRKDFARHAPGTLVSVETGWAFDPAPLPPELTITRDLLIAAESASSAIGQLVGQARLIQNLNLIMRPLIRREAVLSSKIEDTQTEIRELLLQEAAPGEPQSENSDLPEVMNYLAALELGQQWLEEGRELSVSLIRELHARLLLGVRGDSKHPGALRQSVVYIGSRAIGFDSARFVPPPPEQVEPHLDDLVSFAAGDTSYGPLIDCALLHYQFETIHPFEDGNGRIGRLLIPLYLLQRHVLDRPFLYLSAYFEVNRSAYVDHLLSVSTNATWHEWILFFLEGIRAQAEDARRRVQRILDLRDRYVALIRSHAKSRVTLPALDLVLEKVFVSVRQVAEFVPTTAPTAKAALDELTELGIVAPYSRIRGTQYWLSQELLSQLYEN